jgi:5-methyltetrahydropteroyltriglutamate--homocysteine methyltransferase
MDVAVEAMDVTTSGLDAYFITHACYGSFETIFPGMFRMPVDNFDLTTENYGIALVEMFAREAGSRDLSYGVVDPHSHAIEPVEEVERRIREALKLVQAERLWLDPDCGLKTRTVEESQAKIRVIVEGAKRVRATLPSRV